MTAFTAVGFDLFDALSNIAPHLAHDGTLPVLDAAQVTVDDNGVVTVVATDRYTLAVAELVVAEGGGYTPGTFLIPRDECKALVKLAKAARTLTVTVVGGDNDTYTARALDGARVGGRTEIGEYPKWRSLWPTGAAVAVDKVGLGAGHLAKFAKLYDGGRARNGVTLAVTFYGPTKPALVEPFGFDGFRALVMPCRLGAP